MKITIRKGMFETNSSSMHSIIIGKDTDYKEKYDDRSWGGCKVIYTLNIDNESYTRGEGRLLLTPFAKTKFLMALFTTFYGINHDKGGGSFIPSDWEENWKNFSDYVTELFKKRKVNVVLAKPYIFQGQDSYTDNTDKLITYSFVDVKFDEEGFYEFSSDKEKIFSKEMIENIIFNQKSYIIIGGDEYDSCFDIYAFMVSNTDTDNYIKFPYKNDISFKKEFDEIHLGYDEANTERIKEND